MYDMYGKACFSHKMYRNCRKLFKEVGHNIRDENWPGRPTMASSSEIVDWVNAFILDDRWIRL